MSKRYYSEHQSLQLDLLQRGELTSRTLLTHARAYRVEARQFRLAD
ncbi:MAG TPA: hypothetical protein VK850_05750 [Candidatus Binatia bacterium]|nr:hypothetical protein [Candidatus Binatia bacterium]